VFLSEVKRKLEEAAPVVEEVKKPKIDGDVPEDLVSEIVATINDPEDMVGPDVRSLQWFSCHNN